MEYMYSALLILAIITGLALGWWKKWLRRGMWTGGLFALPFLLIQSLASGSFYLPGAGFWGPALSVIWAFVIGALAGAFYAFFLHHWLSPVLHPRRSLMLWLFIGPLVMLGVYFIGDQSLLIASLTGIGVDILLILILQWVLVWDTVSAMVGMSLLYLLLYFFFGQVLRVSFADSGVLLLGYPVEDLLRVAVFGALWGPPYAALRAISRGDDRTFLAQHHIPKQVVTATSVAILLVAFAWVNGMFMRTPRVVSVLSTTYNDTDDYLTRPLSIQLDRPVDRTVVGVEITPPVEGDVSFEDSYLQRTFVRRIVFTPRSYFQPETSYAVKITSLKNILSNNETSYTYEFRTPALPAVTGVVPQDKAGDIPICDPLTVTLDQPTARLADISFALSPSVPFDIQKNDDGKQYTLKPTECLAQSQEYTLSVLRSVKVSNNEGVVISTQDPVAISTTTFITKGAPGIGSVTPQGDGVLVSNRELTVNFTEPMEQADLATHFTLSPPLAGSWIWRDPKTAVFTFATNLPFDTHITLTQNLGLKDEHGGILSAGTVFAFGTIGPVNVSGISPRNGSAGVKAGSAISFTFDQPVDRASAESRFSLSPSLPGTFSWQGQTMTYSTSLAKDTSYQASVAAGVVSQIGQPSTAVYTSTFQTEESVTQLNIGVYYQQHALSCELASLKMALNYKGIGVTENQLLDQIPTDGAARNGNTWADPDQVFVGDVNGHQNTTGYGVHAGPILSLASNYRTSRNATGWSMQELAQTLADGNPVVIWGTAGSMKKDSWVTPGGRTIDTWVGEHARTLIGFTGKVDNPTSFIINDPIFGRLRWSTSQFRGNWSLMGSMGVAIF